MESCPGGRRGGGTRGQATVRSASATLGATVDRVPGEMARVAMADLPHAQRDDDAVVGDQAVLSTKLHVPRPPSTFVSRPRLTERLDRARRGTAVLVCAPPGSGKSVLVSDWCRRRSSPVAWLSLDTDDIVTFVRRLAERDVPVAAVCHAPSLLIEAGLVAGRTMTSWPSIRTDLVNAGAIVVDEEVVVDGRFISSRRPDDLPAFSAAIIEQLGS